MYDFWIAWQHICATLCILRLGNILIGKCNHNSGFIGNSCSWINMVCINFIKINFRFLQETYKKDMYDNLTDEVIANQTLPLINPVIYDEIEL